MFDVAGLKARFRYDPETGVIFRRKPDGTEERASYLCSRQRRNRVSFKSQKIFAYRLGWLLHYGDWPRGEIDHINGDQSDDRLCNLRDVSRDVNQENFRKPTSRNRLGVLGVSRKANRYYANIKIKGRGVFLGTYKTPEEAHAAYVSAKRRLHSGCTI